jgi:Rieske 2Fe-2S family protein
MPQAVATESVTETEAAPQSRIGRALGARYYTDELVLRRELNTIFQRTWQYAGHVSDLPEPGHYVTAMAGDQPVLVLHGADGELRAFRNVCRHRGSELLTGRGRCKQAIRCRYHGWTYDASDGRLLGVPEHRNFEALDKAKLGLMPARVEVLAGLLFVNLDEDAPPLAAATAGLAPRLERYGIAGLERFSSSKGGSAPDPKGERQASTQPANWKIVAENYLEGYHVPIAHPSLMRLLDYKRYSAETHGGWAWFDAPLRDAPSGNRIERLYQRLLKPMPGLEGEDRRAWRYAFIYPNTAIDLYPDQVNVWQIQPFGVETTRDVWACFRHERSSPTARLVQRINNRLNTEVLDEDIDLVAAVQTGVRTTGYEPGPLSAREQAVGWFAERVRADLGIEE